MPMPFATVHGVESHTDSLYCMPVQEHRIWERSRPYGNSLLARRDATMT